MASSGCPRQRLRLPAFRYVTRAVRPSSRALRPPLEFNFGQVPLRRFELRGQLGPDLSFRPGAAVYAETVCATVPIYGRSPPSPGSATQAASSPPSNLPLGCLPRIGQRPAAGVRAGAITLRRPTGTSDGVADAVLTGPGLPVAARHVAAILLTDAKDTPVALDYKARTSLTTDTAGRITAVHLTIPRGTALPRHVRAHLILDAFPLAERLV